MVRQRLLSFIDSLILLALCNAFVTPLCRLCAAFVTAL
jgi:hypothetical protein